MKDVLTVTEYEKDGQKKSRWTKIGVAFESRDGTGLNIMLDALPMNGRLIVRERREKEEGGF